MNVFNNATNATSEPSLQDSNFYMMMNWFTESNELYELLDEDFPLHQHGSFEDEVYVYAAQHFGDDDHLQWTCYVDDDDIRLVYKMNEMKAFIEQNYSGLDEVD